MLVVAVVVVATGVDRAIVPEGGVVVGNLEVHSALPWVFVESTGGPINIVRNAHTRHFVDAVRNSDASVDGYTCLASESALHVR